MLAQLHRSKKHNSLEARESQIILLHQEDTLSRKVEMSLLPPGYRFDPTDMEIMEFLRKKMVYRDTSVELLIPEINVLEFEPWDIFGLLSVGPNDKECYFFSPRKRKYARSDRADRCTKGGHWKPTGKRPKILTLGIKRRLTFYQGRSHPRKTGYIMHQYELNDRKEFTFCCLKRIKDKETKTRDVSSNTSLDTLEDNEAEDTSLEQQANQGSFQPFQLQVDFTNMSSFDQGELHGQFIQQEANQEWCIPQLDGGIDFTNMSSFDQGELLGQLIQQEANQELCIPQLYGGIDFTNMSSFDQGELLGQLIQQETNQELCIPQLHGGIDFTNMSSFDQGELHDQLNQQEENQELVFPPSQMYDGIDFFGPSFEKNKLYDLLPSQEGNQNMLVQPVLMDGCIDSSGQSLLKQGEPCDNLDRLIDDFINCFPPDSPMESDIINE